MRQLSVFEPFAGDGLNQAVSYAYLPFIDRLVGWEMDPMRAKVLKHAIPGADVKICDSFQGVHHLEPHFDVILIDGNVVQVPFEHFDLFPDIFKGLRDESFFIVSVCDSPNTYYVDREQRIRSVLGTRTESWVKDWDRARCDFYGMSHYTEADYMTTAGRIVPQSVLPAPDMIPVYMEKALKSGFFTAYKSSMRRSKSMSYIVLELRRSTPKRELEENYKDKKLRQDAGKL
jgi:hypothetical protein